MDKDEILVSADFLLLDYDGMLVILVHCSLEIRPAMGAAGETVNEQRDGEPRLWFQLIGAMTTSLDSQEVF